MCLLFLEMLFSANLAINHEMSAPRASKNASDVYRFRYARRLGGGRDVRDRGVSVGSDLNVVMSEP
jgi:hypothetical protein